MMNEKYYVELDKLNKLLERKNKEAKRDLADSVIAATNGEALAGLTRERLAELLGDES